MAIPSGWCRFGTGGTPCAWGVSYRLLPACSEPSLSLSIYIFIHSLSLSLSLSLVSLSLSLLSFFPLSVPSFLLLRALKEYRRLQSRECRSSVCAHYTEILHRKTKLSWKKVLILDDSSSMNNSAKPASQRRLYEEIKHTSGTEGACEGFRL